MLYFQQSIIHYLIRKKHLPAIHLQCLNKSQKFTSLLNSDKEKHSINK